MITFFLKGPTFLEKELIGCTRVHRGSRELAVGRLEVQGVFCDRVPEKTSNPRAIIIPGVTALRFSGSGFIDVPTLALVASISTEPAFEVIFVFMSQ